MPVAIERRGAASVIAHLRERRVRPGALRDRGRRLRLDLVNNMPDAAVLATQRQFVKLLEEGARDFDVALGLVMLDTVERAPEVRRELEQSYATPAYLAGFPPDAVVITGAEPRADRLEQEPYWGELTSLFDLVQARALAVLASCLAAHALVQHQSGVRRRRGSNKWSGLYWTTTAAHPLTESVEPGWNPHSRWNDLDEADLRAAGYVVLTRSQGAGVDAFARDDGALGLFLQGHPEYDGDTLAREWRRDVLRSMSSGAAPPSPPVNYYPADLEQRLVAHVAGVRAGGEAPGFPLEMVRAREPDWRRRTGALVANWLEAIAARNEARNPTRLCARYGG